MTRSPMWAITCLFNPAGYRSRVANYRIFREGLNLPLLAVELAWEGPFSLTEGDADILIQLRGGARLWQKERLLNVAIQNLPPDCTQVVWMDADLVFRESNWVEMTQERLEEVPVVQSFSLVRYLTSDGDIERTRPASAFVYEESGAKPGWLELSRDRQPGSPSPGHVWAARRQLLDEIGLLYDYCVIGGGDTAFLCALTGEIDLCVHLQGMGAPQARKFREWAQKVYDPERRRIGYVPGIIDHLWHGSMEGRKGRERHFALARAGFDPYEDVGIGSNGAWYWKSDKRELHDYLRSYFEGRNEDVALGGGALG
jgi:hypothetical protein